MKTTISASNTTTIPNEVIQDGSQLKDTNSNYPHKSPKYNDNNLCNQLSIGVSLGVILAHGNSYLGGRKVGRRKGSI